MDQASDPCPVCGQSHANAPTDYGFELPDDALRIPEQARAANVKSTADLCQIPGHNFVRCVLPVPFTFRPGFFGWGVWAEVAWPTFQRYLELAEQDAPPDEPQHRGRIANQVPFDELSTDAEVLVQFGPKTRRPALHFAEGSTHFLATHQKQGYNPYDYHLILAGLKQI
jgi:hypothetical protein